MKVTRPAGALAVLFALVAPAAAQQPPGPPPPPAAQAGPRVVSVEAALRFKEPLKLTESQQSQLEAIRKEIVAERQAHMRERIDLQSRAAAGLIAREELRRQFESQREALRPVRVQRQERIAQILTQEQQTELRRLVRERMMHRAQGRRGGPGYPPRFRGRGMGPGFGEGRPFGFGRGERLRRFGW